MTDVGFEQIYIYALHAVRHRAQCCILRKEKELIGTLEMIQYIFLLRIYIVHGNSEKKTYHLKLHTL